VTCQAVVDHWRVSFGLEPNAPIFLMFEFAAVREQTRLLLHPEQLFEGFV
jgi:hypothetical protein